MSKFVEFLHKTYSVFGVFGSINWVRMPTDPLRPGRHRGFAYMDYDTLEHANDAVRAMNMFDLGGQQLRVAKVSTHTQHTYFLIMNIHI